MYIGIDLGGTNIAAAIVDGGGRIQKRCNIPTNADGGAQAIAEGLADVCRTLLKNEGAIASIGIGVPGAVNSLTGDVIFTPNLPLSGVNISRDLQGEFGCPVYLGNDANCAALGESVSGGAKGAKDVVFITLGTGVGGGVIIGGHLHSGVNDAAGELGHMVISSGGRLCGCGRRGCWERYASASGIILTAKGFMGAHRDSLLWELCGGVVKNLDGRMVFDAFRAGDGAAALTLKRYVEHLAVGVVNLINIFEPELFCVGGGISSSWDCFAEPLQAAVDGERFMRFSADSPQTRIVKATLGNDAGIIGAAMLGVY